MCAIVASTIEGLGTPAENGLIGLLRTENVEMPFKWNLEHEVWIGSPFVSMRINENIGLAKQGAPNDWRYVGNFTETPQLVTYPVQNRFYIHKVVYGGELWDAGARIQEHLSGEIRQFGSDLGDVDTKVGLAWYPLDDGDDFLSPEPFNVGVPLIRDKDDDPERYRWCSTGWQNNTTLGVGTTVGDTTESNIPPTLTQHLYPEIYIYGCACSLRRFTAKHRWVGGVDLGPSGSFEIPSKFPPFTGSGDDTKNVRGWYRADNIASAVGAPVSHWADYSGYGRPCRQPTSTRQPILTIGDLGSHKFLRFDGVNDYMGNHLSDRPNAGPEQGQPAFVGLVAPYSFNAVIRQRASGGTQQVWFNNMSGLSPLIYRNDNDGALNTWVGSEPSVDIGSWPSPWLIYSLRVNSDFTYSIRLNGSEIASGSGATADFGGFVVGNRISAELPAAIDVAEILYTYGNMTQAEQIALVDYLNDYYEIF